MSLWSLAQPAPPKIQSTSEKMPDAGLIPICTAIDLALRESFTIGNYRRAVTGYLTKAEGFKNTLRVAHFVQNTLVDVPPPDRVRELIEEGREAGGVKDRWISKDSDIPVQAAAVDLIDFLSDLNLECWVADSNPEIVAWVSTIADSVANYIGELDIRDHNEQARTLLVAIISARQFAMTATLTNSILKLSENSDAKQPVALVEDLGAVVMNLVSNSLSTAIMSAALARMDSETVGPLFQKLCRQFSTARIYPDRFRSTPGLACLAPVCTALIEEKAWIGHMGEASLPPHSVDTLTTSYPQLNQLLAEGTAERRELPWNAFDEVESLIRLEPNGCLRLRIRNNLGHDTLELYEIQGDDNSRVFEATVHSSGTVVNGVESRFGEVCSESLRPSLFDFVTKLHSSMVNRTALALHDRSALIAASADIDCVTITLDDEPSFYMNSRTHLPEDLAARLGVAAGSEVVGSAPQWSSILDTDLRLLTTAPSRTTSVVRDTAPLEVKSEGRLSTSARFDEQLAECGHTTQYRIGQLMERIERGEGLKLKPVGKVFEVRFDRPTLRLYVRTEDFKHLTFLLIGSKHRQTSDIRAAEAIG